MNKLVLKCLLVLCLLVFVSNILLAQADQTKRTVGVMQFFGACNDCRGKSSELQQIVVEVFTTKKHIIQLDRSTDSIINKELDRQKQGEAINSVVLVEQGKKLGAQDMVAGTITRIDAETKARRSWSIWDILLKKESGIEGKSTQRYSGK